ncbi:MAG: roadblock/LC7 domain-containing protein [Acidobacteriota bacterium]
MPFHYLLTNLMADVPGLRGAIFVDPEGEAIEHVSRDGGLYELKLEGAYHGIFLRRASQLASVVGAGELERLVVAGSGLQVVTTALKDGYYLVLVLDAGAPISSLRGPMQRTVAALNREIV